MDVDSDPDCCVCMTTPKDTSELFESKCLQAISICDGLADQIARGRICRVQWFCRVGTCACAAAAPRCTICTRTRVPFAGSVRTPSPLAACQHYTHAVPPPPVQPHFVRCWRFTGVESLLHIPAGGGGAPARAPDLSAHLLGAV